MRVSIILISGRLDTHFHRHGRCWLAKMYEMSMVGFAESSIQFQSAFGKASTRLGSSLSMYRFSSNEYMFGLFSQPESEFRFQYASMSSGTSS